MGIAHKRRMAGRYALLSAFADGTPDGLCALHVAHEYEAVVGADQQVRLRRNRQVPGKCMCVFACECVCMRECKCECGCECKGECGCECKCARRCVCGCECKGECGCECKCERRCECGCEWE